MYAAWESGLRWRTLARLFIAGLFEEFPSLHHQDRSFDDQSNCSREQLKRDLSGHRDARAQSRRDHDSPRASNRKSTSILRATSAATRQKAISFVRPCPSKAQIALGNRRSVLKRPPQLLE